MTKTNFFSKSSQQFPLVGCFSAYSAALSFEIKVVAVVIPMPFNEHISLPPTYLFTAAHIKGPRMNLDCCCDDGHAYRFGIPAQPLAWTSDFIDGKFPGNKWWIDHRGRPNKGVSMEK